MLTEDQLRNLCFIRERYGLMLLKAAQRCHHRPEVLAGIMMCG